MIVNIHTLTQLPAGLLNRDFRGHIKTVPYGNASRTRISSAALKRVWRDAKGPWAISELLPAAVRSRAVFREMVAEKLVAAGHDPLLVAHATLPWIHAVCGQSDNAKRKDEGVDPMDPLASLLRNEAVSMTEPELAWIRGRVEAALALGEDADGVTEAAEADTRTHRANVKAIADNASIETVLTGRFTSGDAASRSEAALSVAHAFTTHRHQAVRDSLALIDTLLTPRTGAAACLNEQPIAAGTFYGYSCLSLPVMVSNLTGCAQGDWQAHANEDAHALVERMILTIYNATIRTGKTTGASFGKPGLVMVELGPWHQINHAEAFEAALDDATVRTAGRRLADYLGERDAFEGFSGEGRQGVTRLYASIDRELEIPGATRMSVAELARRTAELALGTPAGTAGRAGSSPRNKTEPEATSAKKARSRRKAA